MLYNYAKYKGHDLTAEGDLSAFPDGDSVQEWALSAMSWANGNGLINGHDDGTLEPGGTTTRATGGKYLDAVRPESGGIKTNSSVKKAGSTPGLLQPPKQGRGHRKICGTVNKEKAFAKSV